MFAHRNEKGTIVGWLFICLEHAHLMVDKDLVVDLVEKEKKCQQPGDSREDGLARVGAGLTRNT